MRAATLLALVRASTPASSSGSWRLTFSDEFDTLNSSNWNVASGGTHGANELQLCLLRRITQADRHGSPIAAIGCFLCLFPELLQCLVLH